MRVQIDSKSYTCTEDMFVDAASISLKVVAHYPGRSDVLPLCYLVLSHCWIIVSNFNVIHEPPYPAPYVRWCERTEGATPPPTRS